MMISPSLMIPVVLDGVMVVLLVMVMFLELWNLRRYLNKTHLSFHIALDSAQNRYASGDITLPELHQILEDVFRNYEGVDSFPVHQNIARRIPGLQTGEEPRERSPLPPRFCSH